MLWRWARMPAAIAHEVIIMKFTIPEACVIADCLNGISRDEGVSFKEHLQLHVACALTVDRFDVKWGVDGSKLVEMLGNLSEEEASDVVEKVDKFWTAEPHLRIESGLNTIGMLGA